jgi:pimeloyl-ACP methyl ester carboxylesterase
LAGGSANGPLSKLELDLIAVPPRSYGLSTNARPNQRALLSDYRAVVKHVTSKYAELDKRDGAQTKIVWYGHSLGASIATCLLASISKQDFEDRKIVCDGLIFENGFASIKGMVRTLYPQRFLPYYWLTPFVADDWNAVDVFESNKKGDFITNTVPKLFIASEKDEMVPTEMVKRIYERAVEYGEPGVPCEWLGVRDAMHDFAYQKPSWLGGIIRFIAKL